MKIRETPYDCETEGHIPGTWMPTDRFTVRRVCKVCAEVETKDVRGVPNG